MGSFGNALRQKIFLGVVIVATTAQNEQCTDRLNVVRESHAGAENEEAKQNETNSERLRWGGGHRTELLKT
jgi:hypothetical protein